MYVSIRFIPLAISLPVVFWFVGLLLLVALIVTFFLVQKQDKNRRIDFLKTRTYEFGALVAVSGPLKGQQFPVVRSGLTIGREGSTCDIVVSTGNISREHARIFLMGDRPILADLHSKNGTYVNDNFIIQHDLKDGDKIMLGRKNPTVFEFRLQ